MQEKNSKFTNFRLLLKFLKGDNRVKNSFRLSMSIHSKTNAIKILGEEVLLQIPKCLEEYRIIKDIEKVEDINMSVMQSVYESAQYALDSPFPEPKEALEDVFAS